jgi:hypothetical protein
LLASGEVLLDALRERCPSDGVALNLRHQRGAQSLRPLKVRELSALPRHDVSVRRATMNPDWALAFHPKPALLARHAALTDCAVLRYRRVLSSGGCACQACWNCIGSQAFRPNLRQPLLDDDGCASGLRIGRWRPPTASYLVRGLWSRRLHQAGGS